jgi:hypothetical protein
MAILNRELLNHVIPLLHQLTYTAGWVTIIQLKYYVLAFIAKN